MRLEGPWEIVGRENRLPNQGLIRGEPKIEGHEISVPEIWTLMAEGLDAEPQMESPGWRMWLFNSVAT
jgi:hypothetical protein